jgi:dipeptidyl aminopeptidase/acylaminoacyl peptidase
MAGRAMTVEDLWAIPRVGSPIPSPDGAQAVVPVTGWSLETNEATTRLWLVGGRNGRRGAARVLTAAESSAGQPAWSPDGRRLAFIRRPGAAKNNTPRHPLQPQLYVMNVYGGEPERLTDLPLGAADPRWLPDGRRVAFLAPVFGRAPSIEKTEKLAKEREAEPVKAIVTEDRVYRHWDRYLTDGKVHHIFVLDLETRELVDLIPRSQRWFGLMEPSGNYRISPDGREVAFSACRTTPPHDPMLWGVFVVPVGRPGAERLITGDHPAGCHRPVYSPDGRWIVYGMQREFDFYADKVRLVAYDRHARTHSVMTEEWDGSATGWTFGEDPRFLYFGSEVDARTAIFRLDVASAVRDPKRSPPRELARGGWYGEPHVAGGRIFCTLDSLRQPPEAITLGLDGGGPKRLTSFTAPALRGVELCRVEDIRFPGAEGHKVQMFVLHPPGARRGPMPLVHMIHGGPHGAFGDQWHWRWNPHLFASPGYRVAMVNFHGSTSWGQEFTASILGRWGDQPYRDVMAATDLLIERGLADPRRMAAAGGSYGGYLVSWIASQTDRFACLVNHAGVCDLQSQYASDVTQGRQRSMGGEPWDRIEGMDRWNPMRYARGFKSPMLVLHGERDYRVPYTLGLEIYNVYKAMKLPARLAVYPDENHWILKPRNSRHWYGEVLGWLRRWLGKRVRARRAAARSRR